MSGKPPDEGGGKDPPPPRSKADPTSESSDEGEGLKDFFSQEPLPTFKFEDIAPPQTKNPPQQKVTGAEKSGTEFVSGLSKPLTQTKLDQQMDVESTGVQDENAEDDQQVDSSEIAVDDSTTGQDLINYNRILQLQERLTLDSYVHDDEQENFRRFQNRLELAAVRLRCQQGTSNDADMIDLAGIDIYDPQSIISYTNRLQILLSRSDDQPDTVEPEVFGFFEENLKEDEETGYNPVRLPAIRNHVENELEIFKSNIQINLNQGMLKEINERGEFLRNYLEKDEEIQQYFEKCFQQVKPDQVDLLSAQITYIIMEYFPGKCDRFLGLFLRDFEAQDGFSRCPLPGQATSYARHLPYYDIQYENHPAVIAREENSRYQEYYLQAEQQKLKSNKKLKIGSRDLGFMKEGYHLITSQKIVSPTVQTMYAAMQNILYMYKHAHIYVDDKPIREVMDLQSTSAMELFILYGFMLAIISTRNNDSTFILNTEITEEIEVQKTLQNQYEDRMAQYQVEYKKYLAEAKTYEDLRQFAGMFDLTRPVEPVRPELPQQSSVLNVKISAKEAKSRFDLADEGPLYNAIKEFIGRYLIKNLGMLAKLAQSILNHLEATPQLRSLNVEQVTPHLRTMLTPINQYVLSHPDIVTHVQIKQDIERLEKMLKDQHPREHAQIYKGFAFPFVKLFYMIYWRYVLVENQKLDFIAQFEKISLLSDLKNNFDKHARDPQKINAELGLDILVEVLIAALRGKSTTNRYNIYTQSYRVAEQASRPKIQAPNFKAPPPVLDDIREDNTERHPVQYRHDISDFMQMRPSQARVVHPNRDLLHLSGISSTSFNDYKDATIRQSNLFSHSITLRGRMSCQVTINNIKRIRREISALDAQLLADNQAPLTSYIIDPQSVLNTMHLQVDLESTLPVKARGFRPDQISTNGKNTIVRTRSRQFVITFQFRYSSSPYRLPVLGEYQIFQMCAVDLDGKYNARLPSTQRQVNHDGSTPFVRVMQSRDLRTGAGYPMWVVVCSDSETCLEAYSNFMSRYQASPMCAAVAIQIGFLMPQREISIPTYIQDLPVSLYEMVLPESTVYAREYVYNLIEFNADPIAFWQRSTVVLGYIGTITLFNYFYGISLKQAACMPRYLIEYPISKVFCSWFYINNDFGLQDPYSIRSISLHDESIVSGESLLASVNANNYRSPQNYGQSTAFILAHRAYLVKTEGGFCTHAEVVEQDRVRQMEPKNTSDRFYKEAILNTVINLRQASPFQLSGRRLNPSRMMPHQLQMRIIQALAIYSATSYIYHPNRSQKIFKSDGFVTLSQTDREFPIVTTLPKFKEFDNLPKTQYVKDRDYQYPSYLLALSSRAKNYKLLLGVIDLLKKFLLRIQNSMEGAVALGLIGRQYNNQPIGESTTLYDLFNLTINSQYIRHQSGLVELSRGLVRAARIHFINDDQARKARKRKTGRADSETESGELPVYEKAPQPESQKKQKPSLTVVAGKPINPQKGQGFQQGTSQPVEKGSWLNVASKKKSKPKQQTKSPAQPSRAKPGQPPEQAFLDKYDPFRGDEKSIPEKFRVYGRFKTMRENIDYRDLTLKALKHTLPNMRTILKKDPTQEVRDRHDYCEYWLNRKTRKSSMQKANVGQKITMIPPVPSGRTQVQKKSKPQQGTSKAALSKMDLDKPKQKYYDPQYEDSTEASYVTSDEPDDPHVGESKNPPKKKD